jgi:hypothetical protein
MTSVEVGSIYNQRILWADELMTIPFLREVNALDCVLVTSEMDSTDFFFPPPFSVH